MLDIIDELNLAGVQDGDLLVSFDITNMFPSINNQTGVERVQRKLYMSMPVILTYMWNVLLRHWRFA